MNSCGYGVDIVRFRGTKHIVPARVGIALRVVRTLQLLNQWYGRQVQLKSFDMQFSKTATDSGLVIRLDIGLSKGELYYS